MRYTLLDAASDLDQFNTQARNSFQSAYDVFINSLPDDGPISEYSFKQAVAQFDSDIQQAVNNSIDQIKCSPNVKDNPAANSLWDKIGDLATAAAKEACPICVAIKNAEPIPQDKQEYVNSRMNTDLTEWVNGANFSLGGEFVPASDLPAVASAGGVGKIAATKLALQTAGVWVVQNWDSIESGLTRLRDWFAGLWNSVINYRQPPDPLVLDLDGDGIETIAVSAVNAVMYDYNGNEIKTNTGWVSPDDGFLVFDRNGNGAIDNASELFSDYTPLYVGGQAADGFAALLQEDTNNDGIVNNLDANWNNLKIWQDINSDGISQSEELLTMEEAGISGLNVAKSNINQNFPNGNSIKGTGKYIKSDGTTGLMGDVYFAVDTTSQQFPDTPVLPEVEGLPNIWGSGLVRDLQQAAMY
jgi:hypothetical protein